MRFRLLLSLMMVLPMLVLFTPQVVAGTDPADSFTRSWERTDKPVADGRATRTWMWGPQQNTDVISEPYWDAETVGWRDAVYYDKSRMEITNPSNDASSVWYVTNGLLVVELVTGRMQLGDDLFHDYAPAEVNVAGDADDPDGPTYASFESQLGAEPRAVDTVITDRISRSGEVRDDPSLATQDVVIALVDDVTNHGIAAPFWAFMNSGGMIYQDGAFVDGNLFENPYFATGRPITEAYWANVSVGGQQRDVLVQCFERRCLTYTPDNAPEWRVEAGNIGQHYYAWRYVEIGHVVMPRQELGSLTASWQSCNDFEQVQFSTLDQGFQSAAKYFGQDVTLVHDMTFCSVFYAELGLFWDIGIGDTAIYAGDSQESQDLLESGIPTTDITIFLEPGNDYGWPWGTTSGDICTVERAYKHWTVEGRYQQYSFREAPGPFTVEAVTFTDPVQLTGGESCIE